MHAHYCGGNLTCIPSIIIKVDELRHTLIDDVLSHAKLPTLEIVGDEPHRRLARTRKLNSQ